MKKIRILAVASIGGHWIQLLRITESLKIEFEFSFLSTHEKCAIMVKEHQFYKLNDFNRWDFYKLFLSFYKAIKIIIRNKPDVVISTGAAPGLITLFAAKILCKKTIWIDSIANIQRLSFSGKIASLFVSQTYTQWESLSAHRILFAGSVFE
jgi:UDP-N-acetylglucosamine:LPS N-acetylglucosamine transferase